MAYVGWLQWFTHFSFNFSRTHASVFLPQDRLLLAHRLPNIFSFEQLQKINSIISAPILFDEMLLLNILKDPFPSIKVKLCLEVSLPLERKIRKPTTTTTDQQIWTLSRVSTPPWLYETIPDPSQTFKGRNMIQHGLTRAPPFLLLRTASFLTPWY